MRVLDPLGWSGSDEHGSCMHMATGEVGRCVEATLTEDHTFLGPQVMTSYDIQHGRSPEGRVMDAGNLHCQALVI